MTKRDDLLNAGFIELRLAYKDGDMPVLVNIAAISTVVRPNEKDRKDYPKAGAVIIGRDHRDHIHVTETYTEVVADIAAYGRIV